MLHQIWKFSICGVMLFAVGCYAGSYAGYEANKAAGGGTDAAMGEQHDVPYSAHDAFLLTEDALRGEGVLFDPEPEDKLVTLWRDADTKAGVLGDLVGVHPQYRYEIEVVPQGSRRFANHRQCPRSGYRRRRSSQV